MISLYQIESCISRIIASVYIDSRVMTSYVGSKQDEC